MGVQQRAEYLSGSLVFDCCSPMYHKMAYDIAQKDSPQSLFKAARESQRASTPLTSEAGEAQRTSCLAD